MVYVPTNNFEEIANMIIEHPWGEFTPYSQKAVIFAMESIKKGDFSRMERIAGKYDYKLPELIDELDDELSEGEWADPLEREMDYCVDLNFGYWADIWDCGRGHYFLSFHHPEKEDGAPLATVTYYAFAHPANEENCTFEDGDCEMFQELAEQAISKYRRFCEE